MPRVVILLPSASYKAPDFLGAAARLGVDVVIASEFEQTMAATMGDRALTIDFDDPAGAADVIARAAARAPLDGIVAVDDQGVLVAALAGERLGLPHNPPAAAAATRDKAAMRQALARAGVPQPGFRLLPPAAGPAAVAAVAAEVGFPCVVKPVSLAASRGVIRADTPAEAVAAAGRARAILATAHGPAGADEPLLVEEYVPGDEVAVEGLLRAGRLEVLAIFDKPDPLTGPYFEETLYVTPSRHPEAAQAAVGRLVAEAATALGLREGPVHAEARLPADGPPRLLEMAARTIGGLCSRALRFEAGASLEEVVLRHAAGLPLGPARDQAASGVMMLPIAQAGRLVAVHGQEEARAVPLITGLEIAIPLGRPVAPLPDGDRYLGFLFARGATPADVEDALRRAHGRLAVVVEANVGA